MSLLVLKNFRLVDETMDEYGSVIAEDGIIKEVYSASFAENAVREIERAAANADMVLNGSLTDDGSKSSLALMPAFVDLHAHFRECPNPVESVDPAAGALPSETLESACLAAAAGGFGTVVCMANTKPVTDTIEKVRAVKNRADALGLVDVYPVLSLTRGMEGTELSEISLLAEKQGTVPAEKIIRLLSEDGKDIKDERIFLAAMEQARRTGIPLSCHCDLDGENNAVKRVLSLMKQSGCRVHIAHVSAKEAAAMIREAKKESALVSCEVTPHHLSLTEKDAFALGPETHGRVNPPLRTEEDRLALIAAIIDGTVDAIATDHAPHSRADKERGAPGFSGLETAFAVCYSTLVVPGAINLSKLSSMLSAAPARILGLDGKSAGVSDSPVTSCADKGRGLIAPGLRADFAVVDTEAKWIVAPETFKSRGKNSPFTGRKLSGQIVFTIMKGVITYMQNL